MIEAIHLTKRFGRAAALDDVSFSCGEGEVLGLLGENGAGKTTTLRILATLLRPSQGTARVGGFDVVDAPEKVRSLLGIIFEGGVYDRFTARENIAYFARLYGLRGRTLDERVDAVTAMLGIDGYANKRAGTLSRGMRQKVVIGRAIVHDPPVILMDEPTASLDVTAAQLVHDFVLEAKRQGKTVIVSSHNMREVEKLCDRAAVIHRGRIAATGTIDELRAQAGTSDLESIFIRLVGDFR